MLCPRARERVSLRAACLRAEKTAYRVSRSQDNGGHQVRDTPQGTTASEEQPARRAVSPRVYRAQNPSQRYHQRTKPGVTRSIPRSRHPDHVLGHGRSSATSDATSRKRATLTAVTTTALRRAPEETHGLHQVPRIRARQSAHWAPSFT